MARILVADDEKAIRVTLTALLRDAGHEVFEAADSREARSWVDQRTLDVALLDLLLGSSSGLDVAQYIRDRQPDVRSILITASPNFDSASQALRLRIFDYLVKPFDKQQLLEIVSQAAAAKAREQEYAALLKEHERYQETLEHDIKERTADLHQTAAELHALAAHLQVVREEERANLARELHDEFGQNLTALRIDLAWLDHHLQIDQPIEPLRLQGRITAMVPMVDRLIEMTQTVCAALRPGILNDLGLIAAIEWQIEECEKRTGLICASSLPADDLDLDPDRALAVFRIVQEALTNVVRHAQATRVAVSLARTRDALTLEVQDNGRGFAQARRLGTKALGLLSMRERAAAFQGVLDIVSSPDQGTAVKVRIPLSASHARRRQAPA
jgi:signal transduction histidine kinase